MEPEVSIVTLTYNHASFIEKCLHSVIQQTFTPWEQIIIDDGSTDGTWDIVSHYAQKDPRITAIRQDNVGPFRMVESYNRALHLSRGRLIAILEGDDLWPKDKLAKQCLYHKGDVIFSYGTTSIIDERGCEVGLYSNDHTEGLFDSRRVRTDLLMRKAGIMPVSTMLDRAVLLSMGGFRTELVTMPDRSIVSYPAIDYPTFLRYLLTNGTVYRSGQLLGYWRKHSEQTTHRHEAVFHEGMYQVALTGIVASGEKHLARGLFRSHRRYAADFYLEALRRSLVIRDEHQASLSIKRLLWWGDYRRQIQALYGMLSLALGKDMEAPFIYYERMKGWKG